MRTALAAVLLALLGCTSGDAAKPVDLLPPPGAGPPSSDPDASGTAHPDGAAPDAQDGAVPPVGTPGNLRVVAANISSGPSLDYGTPAGVRIFEGLHPDVVLIQEMNVGGNSTAEVAGFVSTTFGATFSYYRESGAQIPNGIISRYPILMSGSWVDPAVANRAFAYAKLALPGAHPLWAISLHLLTTGATDRSTEVVELVKQVNAMVPADDYLILGGDFNTSTRTESCITNATSGLSAIVVTTAPYPADGSGNDNTSLARSKPHDWLLADPDLAKRSVPVIIGQHSFASGLVFDSRVYSPLADVKPVLTSDSAAVNTQHMPVVRDFSIP